MPLRPRTDILTYTVQPGDTPISIAAQFNLRPETILWGNPALNAEADSLRIGQTLNILPVDGVLHIVAEGNTLDQLQEAHGTPVADIVAFPGNDLPRGGPYALVAGQQLIIPNGRGSIEWKEPGPLIVSNEGRPSSSFYTGPLIGSGTSKFVWPVSPIVITQYFWVGHRAIDLDTYRGQPIQASDGGTVIYSGWDDTGYGFLVILDHGNGYWTYYAHNSELLVQAGESVVQGQTIALSGSTGNSTGDHLDFRIRQGNVFLNPLEFLP
jgi:murein DD-endopeptidase MepM/ murein hydrolase activator NlpD